MTIHNSNILVCVLSHFTLTLSHQAQPPYSDDLSNLTTLAQSRGCSTWRGFTVFVYNGHLHSNRTSFLTTWGGHSSQILLASSDFLKRPIFVYMSLKITCVLYMMYPVIKMTWLLYTLCNVLSVCVLCMIYNLTKVSSTLKSACMMWYLI